MSTNNLKKQIYKENPIATLQRIKKGRAYYTAIINSRNLIFSIPIDDMGDAEFLNSMSSKLLIRWIINDSEIDEKAT